MLTIRALSIQSSIGVFPDIALRDGGGDRVAPGAHARNRDPEANRDDFAAAGRRQMQALVGGVGRGDLDSQAITNREADDRVLDLLVNASRDDQLNLLVFPHLVEHLSVVWTAG